MGYIWVSYVLNLLSRKVFWHFHFCRETGYIEIVKKLNPLKGVCDSRPREGPSDCLMFYLKLSRKRVLTFMFQWLKSAFLKFQKCFILWMVGWVDCDILPPSIFFICKYINKQDVQIPNMVSNIVYGH